MMRNHLNFSEIINVILDNKKKTFNQYELIECLFSQCLSSYDRSEQDADIIANDNITYSRWCNGTRPVPMDIICRYENSWELMEQDIENKILPNLLNTSHIKELIDELITDSIPAIGQEKADELISNHPLSHYLIEVFRYALLNDHGAGTLLSIDMGEIILENQIPSCCDYFVGRNKELKELKKKLQEQHIVFVTGVAGIGKSEFAKVFAEKFGNKYTNVLYIPYEDNLKTSISNLAFAEDSEDASIAERFTNHYGYIQKLQKDSLIIIDNFNVLPKDDEFFKTLTKCNATFLFTSRCKQSNSRVIELKELDFEKELLDLFLHICPCDDSATVLEIIKLFHGHTLTVCLAAYTMNALGLSATELLDLYEDNGFASIEEDIELYKDNDYYEARMIEHLSNLIHIQGLSPEKAELLRNLSLLPTTGTFKQYFKKWLELENLNDVNELIRYGFIFDDTNNRKISLHPMIADIILADTKPATSNCKTMINYLHQICLLHGIEIAKQTTIMSCLKSIQERLIHDMPEYDLRFLQNMFPYFMKYGDIDYCEMLIGRIEFAMQNYDTCDVGDKALVLDYKATIFTHKKQYDNAIKKRKKALSLLEPVHTKDAPIRIALLLSNVHGNLAQTYLLMDQYKECETELKEALLIRSEYQHFEEMHNHDLLQQLLLYITLLIEQKQYEEASDMLSQYEQLIEENEGTNSVDYGMVQMCKGMIHVNELKATAAEENFLTAKEIFENVLGSENEYTKAIYSNLFQLYSRWKGHETLAKEYRKLIQ